METEERFCFVSPESKATNPFFWWHRRWQERNAWNGTGCQNWPKNEQGPLNPRHYFCGKEWRLETTVFVLPKSAATNPFFWWHGSWQERNAWNGMGCQNWPKNEHGPLNPRHFFFDKDWRLRNDCFSREWGHEPLFWWHGRWQERNAWNGMGCQNWPKNEQEPLNPRHFFFAAKNGDWGTILFCFARESGHEPFFLVAQ